MWIGNLVNHFLKSSEIRQFENFQIDIKFIGNIHQANLNRRRIYWQIKKISITFHRRGTSYFCIKIAHTRTGTNEFKPAPRYLFPGNDKRLFKTLANCTATMMYCTTTTAPGYGASYSRLMDPRM